MPPPRRRVLQTLAGGLSVAVAGCLDWGPIDLRARRFDPADHVDDWHDEPVRGLAAPVESTRRVEPSASSLVSQCGWEAARAVGAVVRNRVGQSPTLRINRTMSSALPYVGWFVHVSRKLYIDNTGEVYRAPEVPFGPLLEVSPRTVDMTVRTEEWMHSCRFPVFLFDSVIQAD